MSETESEGEEYLVPETHIHPDMFMDIFEGSAPPPEDAVRLAEVSEPSDD